MTETEIRAGAGSAELVFPDGYFPTRERFDRILDPLHCKVLMVEGKQKLCIVSLELPSLKPGSVLDEIRNSVAALTGYEEDEIWIGITHNMNAPHVPSCEKEPDEYRMHLSTIQKAVKEAVEMAEADMREAVVGTGSGEANINVNRDFETKDGWWIGTEGTGPSDKAVIVLRFDDLYGRPIGVLFTYSVKSSVLEDSYDANGRRCVTSEVTGRACRYVEDRIHAPVLYFMASAADQVPKKKASYYSQDEEGHLIVVDHPEEGVGWMDAQAVKLGRSVLDVEQRIVCSPVSFLYVGHVDLTYPGLKVAPEEKSRKGPRKTCLYLPDDPRTIRTELFAVNDLAIVGVKPEITSITGMTLRRRSPFRYTTIASMINGGAQYMPDISVYDRYLFEGIHAAFAQGTAEQFVDDMTGVLNKIKAGANGPGEKWGGKKEGDAHVSEKTDTTGDL